MKNSTYMMLKIALVIKLSAFTSRFGTVVQLKAYETSSPHSNQMLVDWLSNLEYCAEELIGDNHEFQVLRKGMLRVSSRANTKIIEQIHRMVTFMKPLLTTTTLKHFQIPIARTSAVAINLKQICYGHGL